jgi:hypothetical protein
MSEQQAQELLERLDRIIAAVECTRDATLALVGMRLSGEPPEGFQAAYLRARAAGTGLAEPPPLLSVGSDPASN